MMIQMIQNGFILALSLLALDKVEAAEIAIKGVGGDFLGPLFETWGLMYAQERREYAEIDVQYNGFGSGIGECMLAKKCKQTFGPYAYAVSTKLHHPDLENNDNIVIFPMMAGAMAIVYNLPGIQLSLRMQTIADIFYGKIHYWNDTRLAGQSNVTLPNAEISPVAMIGAVGQTEVLTTALSDYVEEWRLNTSVRNEQSYWRPGVVHYFAKKSVGMVGLIETVRFSIGFTFHTLATQHQLQTAQLLDENNNLVAAETSQDGVRCALNQALDKSSETSYANGNCTSVVQYPFTLIIHVILNRSTAVDIDCNVQTELIRFLKWTVESSAARKEANGRGFYGVRSTAAEVIQSVVESKVTCRGQSVLEMIVAAERAESYIENRHKRMYAIAGGVLAALLGVLIFGFITAHQCQIHYKVYNKEWLVKPEEWYSAKTTGASHHSFTSRYTIRDMLPLSECSGIYNGQLAIVFRQLMQNSALKVTGNYLRTGERAQRLKTNIHHENVQKFAGLMQTEDGICFLYFSPDLKASLWFVIRRYKDLLEEQVRLILANDVVCGMSYLHSKQIIHGNLTSLTCVVDMNWRVKVTDWAQRVSFDQTSVSAGWCAVLRNEFREFANVANEHDIELRRLIISTDPDILIKDGTSKLEAKHDVYSFGVLAIEVFTSEEALSDYNDVELAKLIKRISSSEETFDLPNILSDKEQIIIRKALTRDGELRATFGMLKTHMSTIFKRNNVSIVDILKTSMESYMDILENKVEERTQELKLVTAEMENLLENLLPKEVALKLRSGEKVEPEYFEEVSIYFSDIVGFTKICSASTPLQVVNFLKDIYSGFDEILDKFKVYKVETIGDAYMVVGGIPRLEGPTHAHAREIAAMTLNLTKFVSSYKVRHLHRSLEMRVGLHSGPCMAGVIGVKMPRYCLFGAAVNVATRMEATSLPMKVQASENFITCLAHFPQFIYEPRIWTENLPNPNTVETYWVLGSNEPVEPPPVKVSLQVTKSNPNIPGLSVSRQISEINLKH